jgi:ribosomal protein S18 acetylase RimI-like enzyme
MSQVSYRIATAKDSATLEALFRRGFVDTFGHLYRPEDLAAFLSKVSEEAWRQELADPTLEVRLAEAEGEAVGFAKIGPVSLPVEQEGPATELRQLYVMKPWHGAGIAPDLMAWVIERAKMRGATDLFLSVWSENHRARRFYDRYGFTYVGPYAFMVGNQADEDEIMRLRLEPQA